MTPMGVRVRMTDRWTDRPALLEWVPLLIVNNYSKFEVNIFSIKEILKNVDFECKL